MKRERGCNRRRLAHAAAFSCVLILPAVIRPGLAAEHKGELPVFSNDFGETGLMQNPTARRKETGNFNFTYSHIKPYDHYSFHFQPFSWMQGGFRYTSISDRSYSNAAPDRDYLDKSFDIKFFLLDEGRYKPAVSLGLRDFGGTGLFSSEYLVANKRFWDFDISFGIGWGYMGKRGDISNPIGKIASRFKDRKSGSSGGGKFSTDAWFTGRPAFFGGIQYTTPWRPLTLQVEYEGNNYHNEPSGKSIHQDWPVNIGARLKVNDSITLSAAFERGNRAMLGATVGANLAKLFQPKSDPAPVIPKKTTDNAAEGEDWSKIAQQLDENAGIAVTRITRQGDELVVDGVPFKYRKMAEAELRGNRILHNVASKDISSFKYRWQGGGFYLREDKLPRKPLPSQPLIVDPISPFADKDYRHGVVSSNTDDNQARGEVLYDTKPQNFSYHIGPGLNYNYGGPDGFIYQALVQANASWRTDQNGWFSGMLAYSLFDNTNSIDYKAPTRMHRVRSDVTTYLKKTDLGLYNLQYTRTARLSDNIFAMGYGGLLEQMFGGVGGEILYRPFNSNIALGLDVNWVKKRGYHTDFSFKGYSTIEGHATAYIDTGIQDILAKISVGRYLARDYGATIDLSKTFDSGVTLGAYAVLTSANGSKYGEGSFNKGIYLTMPMDIFFNKSSRSSTTAVYTPLTRDGGASLARQYELYNLTGDRKLNRYWQGFEHDEETNGD